MRSEAIYIDDMESLEGDEMAKLSPRVVIKSRKQQNNKEDNEDDQEGKNEEEDSEESRKEVTEMGDGFGDNLENAYDVNIIQEAKTGSYCEKCDVTFKSKKSLRRHLIKGHGTMACENCDDMFYIWTDSRVHVHKFHENDDDNEEKKKGINEDNMIHKVNGKNDEAEVKPNSRSKDPNLTKDENNIWKGWRRKLFQTSLTQIPMPVDNQKNGKK